MAYTVWIDTETKEVTSIILYQPLSEDEGVRADGIHYVKHFDIEDIETFAETHYFSDDYSEAISRPAKPAGHPYALWNRTTSAWETDIDTYLNRVRSQRNDLLKECDWTQVRDAYLTSDKKAEWADYRTQLRDITKQIIEEPSRFITFIEEVTWPTPPE